VQEVSLPVGLEQVAVLGVKASQIGTRFESAEGG
jgi:hypothetical protein